MRSIALAVALLALSAAPGLAAPVRPDRPPGAGTEHPGAGQQPATQGEDPGATDPSTDPSEDPGDGADSGDDSGDDPSASDGSSCGDDPVTPFERWGDDGDYTLGADFEDDLADWTLAGGARAADGNERFDVGDEQDAGSLMLPAGASATSPAICVSDQAAFARLFTRGTRGGRLRIDVVAGGDAHRAGTLRSHRGGWRPSRRIPIADAWLAQDPDDGATEVTFRFTAVRGSWRVDDLYVDAGDGG